MEKLLEMAFKLFANKLVQRIPNYKRFLYYDIKDSKSKMIGIYGARGVGKTTLIMQILITLKLISIHCKS